VSVWGVPRVVVVDAWCAVWMVVIYAIESWLSLRFRSFAIYIETAREAYEAFVLWSFFRLLLSYLASRYAVGWTIHKDGKAIVLEDRLKASEEALKNDVLMSAILKYTCNEAMERRAEAASALLKGEGKEPSSMSIDLREDGGGITPALQGSKKKKASSTAIVPTSAVTDDHPHSHEEDDDEEEAASNGGASKSRSRGTSSHRGAATPLVNAKHATMYSPHLPPLCCVKPWLIGSPFLHWTRWAVFQYVVVRLVCTVLTLILTPLDLYGEGEFSNPAKFYMYSVIFINLSQCWALYCLALFYFRFTKALHEINPEMKFIVIKAVVFLCWWQSLIVSGIANAGWLASTAEWTSDEVQRGLQDFLICFEMAIISFVHHRVYSYLDFVPKHHGVDTPLLTSFPVHVEASMSGRKKAHDVVNPLAASEDQEEVVFLNKEPHPSDPSLQRRPFMQAVRDMLPQDVIRDAPRVLGPRQKSAGGIVVSHPSEDNELDNDDELVHPHGGRKSKEDDMSEVPSSLRLPAAAAADVEALVVDD
jgi:hypothetical protein